MKLKVKDMDIATGGVQVVLLNQADAKELDLHHSDRLEVRKGRRKTIAVLDIAESRKAVPPGRIGLFEEVLATLHAKHNDVVEIRLAEKPESITFIKKKLDGKRLKPKEIYTIVKDIVDNKLTDIELASFVTASYMTHIPTKEVVALTKAMVGTGQRLKFDKKIVVDLHCIGGVPGNRTTLIVVPILVAAGLKVPKTSSRAITSPAGTADTMEVLCPVSLPAQKLKQIIKKVGGFITWGGAVNLAPADEKIIRVEHPLSLDAEDQMLASIMAKKASVGTTHLLIDMPIGKESKVETFKRARHLKEHFIEIGRALGMKTKVVFTDGTEPVGNGIGPVLEARDCLWLLKNDPRGPQDLKERSLRLAGEILEFTGKAKKGRGKRLAQEILESGKAHKTMVCIIKAQGGKPVEPDKLKPAKLSYIVRAQKPGVITNINNLAITKIARVAGAPTDKDAGLYLHKHKGDKVEKGTPVFTIYARNPDKMKYALNVLRKMGWGEIG